MAFSLTILGATALPHASADAVGTAETDARAAFEQGRAAYERGAFGEALAHFERAQALSPRAELLYNIARSADSDGQTARAMSAYSAYLEAYPTAQNRAFVKARLEKVRALEQEREASRALQPATPTPPPLAGRRREPAFADLGSWSARCGHRCRAARGERRAPGCLAWQRGAAATASAQLGRALHDGRDVRRRKGALRERDLTT
jgi:tetratricopeptide (TPR) repeat protein